MNNEQSIDRAHGCTIRVEPFVNLPPSSVGGQTIQTGRAETDHAEEVLNVFASTE
jgi:hypothetical protein